MFTDVDKAISYIESKNEKHTMEWYENFLKENKIEYNHFNFIHVTGTNGKGSTVNYITNILENSGYQVGTFTSPYLFVHNDRICINNINISDEKLLKYINQYYHLIETHQLSMFEIDLLIALTYFKDQNVDFVILEVGIGGTLDKTNIIKKPLLSIITSIGEDHLSLLGPTILDVARNKAGIIKHQGIVITPKSVEPYQEVIIEKAKQEEAKLIEVEVPYINAFPIHFTYKGLKIELGDVGLYQVSNACLAIETILMLSQFGYSIDQKVIIDTLKTTIWQGRFEKCRYQNKDFYLDGAHNTHGIKALIQSIQSKKEGKEVTIIFSALQDKNYQAMIKLLQTISQNIIITTFEDDRKLDISIFNDRKDVVVEKDFLKALRQSLSTNHFVVVTGSLHFVSYVKKVIG